LARPADWPLIQRLHAEQNRMQGTNTALPEIFTANGAFAENIALAFIVERKGVPVQSFYFELVPEVCFAGCDAKATAYARREIDRIAFLLRSLGFTGINCKVPQPVVEQIAPPLGEAGFQRSVMVNFFKDLRLKGE